MEQDVINSNYSLDYNRYGKMLNGGNNYNPHRKLSRSNQVLLIRGIFSLINFTVSGTFLKKHGSVSK